MSTVSYVLNESGPVAPERRERIFAACKALNYTRNGAARKLRGDFAAAIGLVVPDLSNQYFALLAEGVERAASKRDVLVVLCAPDLEGTTDSTNSRLLRSQRLDGVLYLAGSAAPVEALRQLTEVGPVVLVDERIPGFDVPSVVSDNRRGACEIAKLVLAAGHTRVAVVGGPSTLWTAGERLAGYRDAMVSAGLDPDELIVAEGDYRQGSGTVLAEELLRGAAGRRPTALLCANDLMAVGALEFCRSAGLSVPGDVSIVGFDDLPLAALLQPRLTTVRQPAGDMGRRAANLLLDLIEGSEPVDEYFPVSVQVRGSVAAPKKVRR